MKCSVAIYPSADWRAKRDRWGAYLDLAARYGFTEVFSSIHLPEVALGEQLNMLEALAGEAHARGMELTADIGGGEIDEILKSSEDCLRLRRLGLEFVRLDYGYSVEQAGRMYREWNLKGFMVNASTSGAREAEELVSGLRSIDEAIELRACHNFYPRPETGLDQAFFEEQTRIFAELGLTVYACIPSACHPRPPLGLGLPTLERHRNAGVLRAAVELAGSEGIGGLLAADEFFPEEELAAIRAAVAHEPLTLRIRPGEGLSEGERAMMDGAVHHIRYDSNDQILRSRSSREISRIGGRVAPGKCAPRTRGTVTVDNENYGRYSGELQIVLADLPADPRVNCVGHVLPEDMWKLDYFRKGYDYRLVPEA